MARILIYTNIEEIEYAIWKPTEYSSIYREIQSERNGNWPNFANKLWLQGLVSEIYTEDNQISYGAEKYLPEEINEQFDIMILSCANIFAVTYKELMEYYAKFFSQIHIPVYVISCGIQADSYKELDLLVEQIGDVARKFIDSIYRTGGEFSLRGYFTKEFFDRLGKNSAVVTGCPSLYQTGRDLNITKQKLSEKELKPVVNGQNYMLSLKFYKEIFRNYTESVYIDQDHYGMYLYDPDMRELDELSFIKLSKLVKKEGYYGLRLATEGRLLYFADMPQWKRVLETEQFNFSIGARIHGNIMSILSGIPACVHAWDSRTREMAEFYDIPIVTDEEIKKKTLFEIYDEIDYSKFNLGYSKKYDLYEEFLCKCGIIRNHMNDKNLFFMNEDMAKTERPEIINKKKLSILGTEMRKKERMLLLEDEAFLKYREIKGKQYRMR